ncbi:MAG: hypothetical protein RRY36_10140, partial [Bacteroidaceae bacterium]
SYYKSFITTTSCSAPIPCIGTLILVGFPLEFLPYHQGRRFPSSIQKPTLCSCYLHAGHRLDSKQVSSKLIPS